MHEATYRYRARHLPGRLHYVAADETEATAEAWKPFADELAVAQVAAEHMDYELFRHPEFQTVINDWLVGGRTTIADHSR